MPPPVMRQCQADGNDTLPNFIDTQLLDLETGGKQEGGSSDLSVFNGIFTARFVELRYTSSIVVQVMYYM